MSDERTAQNKITHTPHISLSASVYCD